VSAVCGTAIDESALCAVCVRLNARLAGASPSHKINREWCVALAVASSIAISPKAASSNNLSI